MNPLIVSSDTKGTALIRRDCTKIHKTILKNTINIVKDYLTNTNTNVNTKINEYLMNIFKNIIKNIQNLDVNDFKKSIKYTGKYKDPNNSLDLCVKKYNLDNPNEKISKGQRFDFIYAYKIQNWDDENKKWNPKKYNYKITDHIIILEDYIKNKNIYRISIEKYITDILTNLRQIIYDDNIINNIEIMLKNYVPEQ